MSALLKQIQFVETMTDSLSEGFTDMNVWYINLCFGQRHTLAIQHLIKKMINRCVFLCDLFEQTENW